jgi:hypothetical protein
MGVLPVRPVGSSGVFAAALAKDSGLAEVVPYALRFAPGQEAGKG